jgi:hypothetical protein
MAAATTVWLRLDRWGAHREGADSQRRRGQIAIKKRRATVMETAKGLRQGHIGPSPSSPGECKHSSAGCAAPTLRFGRFAMTTPRRCGALQPWPLLRKAGLLAVFAQQRPLNA